MAKLNRMPTVLKCSPELTPVRDSAENLLSISHHQSGTPWGEICQQPCSWNSLLCLGITSSNSNKQMKKSWEKGKEKIFQLLQPVLNSVTNPLSPYY